MKILGLWTQHYLHSGVKSILSVIFGSEIGLPARKQVLDTIPFVSLCMSGNIYGQDNKNGDGWNMSVFQME